MAQAYSDESVTIPATEELQQPWPDRSTILDRIMGDEYRRKRLEEQGVSVEKFIDSVQQAGNRDKAMEVLRNYSKYFSNPRDYEIAFKTIDEHWPMSTREMRELKVYDEKTGEESARYWPAARITEINDPARVKALFGENATLTKPDIKEFYQLGAKPGEMKYVGKLPASQRPEGALTLQEISEAHKARTEGRQKERDRVTQARFEAHLDLSERRFLAMLERMGEPAGDRERNQIRQIMNDAARLTATSLNAKMLPDGSFGFDDENKTKMFNERLNFMQNLIAEDPGILKRPGAQIELHNKAVKAFPTAREDPARPPEPAPAPKPKSKGLLDRMFGSDEATGDRAPTKANAEIKAAAERAGQKYEPEKYEYKTINGKLYRKLKGKKDGTKSGK